MFWDHDGMTVMVHRFHTFAANDGGLRSPATAHGRGHGENWT